MVFSILLQKGQVIYSVGQLMAGSDSLFQDRPLCICQKGGIDVHFCFVDKKAGSL